MPQMNCRLLRYLEMVTGRHYTNVLFLDFDGKLAPLNHTDYVPDKFGRGFDARCVENLSGIVAATDAKIVVTSSWRGYLSLWRMLRMWECRHLPNALIGMTPMISHNRSREIDVWLARHKVCNYAILDDMDARQFAPHHHHCLVTCNGRIGLSAKDAEQAIRLLNKSY